jgi:hypothetical protein
MLRYMPKLAWVLILQIRRVSQGIRLYRTHSGDFVDVETWVRLVGRVVTHCPDVAAVALIVVHSIQSWLHPIWREREVFLIVRCVTTANISVLQLCNETVVEIEDVVIFLNEWNSWQSLSTVFVLANNRIIHEGLGVVSILDMTWINKGSYAFEVEMSGVILIQHGRGNIWYVSACV